MTSHPNRATHRSVVLRDHITHYAVALDACDVVITRGTDAHGRATVAVSIAATGDKYQGQDVWWLDGWESRQATTIHVVRTREAKR